MPIDRPKRSSDLVYDPKKQRYVESSNPSKPREPYKSQKPHEPRSPHDVKGWLIVYALFLVYQIGSGIFWLMQSIGHMPMQALIVSTITISAYAFAIYSLKYIGLAWVRIAHLVLNGYAVVSGLSFLSYVVQQLLQGNFYIVSSWTLIFLAHIVWIVYWLVSPRAKPIQSAPGYPGAPSSVAATGEAGSGSQTTDLKSFFTVGRVISFLISFPMIIGAFQIFAWGESNNFHLFTIFAGLPLLIFGVTIFIAGLAGGNSALAAFGVFRIIFKLLSR